MTSQLSSALRLELAERAKRYALENGIPWYQSVGTTPTVLFEPFDNGRRHGNFIDASYKTICDDQHLSARLTKRHSKSAALPDEKAQNAKELDSCNSSDALLMNCFCCPGAAQLVVSNVFPSLTPSNPEFGVAGKVALVNGHQDETEVDMRIGSAIFEAKLTEPDFTERSKPHVERYARIRDVFDTDVLPQTENDYRGYQLIRNVLAAEQYGWTFCVVCDARRPDLLREWWLVHSAIRDPALRPRCGFVLWQEIAGACPRPLAHFLSAKYGIGVEPRPRERYS